MKKKHIFKTILLISLPILIFVIGFTIAFYNNRSSINNIFNSTFYGTTLQNSCETPENWSPGNSFTCNVKGKNESDIDVALRAVIYLVWYKDNPLYDLNGTSASTRMKYVLKENEVSFSEFDYDINDFVSSTKEIVSIEHSNTSDWIESGTVTNNEYGTGKVFYYKYKLPKNSSTSYLNNLVTFNRYVLYNRCDSINEDLDYYDENLDEYSDIYSSGFFENNYCETLIDSDLLEYEFAFVYVIETVQYDAYQEVWNTNVVIN